VEKSVVTVDCDEMQENIIRCYSLQSSNASKAKTQAYYSRLTVR